MHKQNYPLFGFTRKPPSLRIELILSANLLIMSFWFLFITLKGIPSLSKVEKTTIWWEKIKN